VRVLKVFLLHQCQENTLVQCCHWQWRKIHVHLLHTYTAPFPLRSKPSFFVNSSVHKRLYFLESILISSLLYTMNFRRVLLLSAIATSVTAKISGLNQSTCATVHASSGLVYIAEKRGWIKVASSINALSASLAVVIPGQVATFGDLGLTSGTCRERRLHMVYWHCQHGFLTLCLRVEPAACPH
jgi:hypothetical protein